MLLLQWVHGRITVVMSYQNHSQGPGRGQPIRARVQRIENGYRLESAIVRAGRFLKNTFLSGEITMRQVTTLALAGFLVLGGVASIRANDRDQALAVIAQGLRAQGGEAALTKSQVRTRKAQGTIFVQDKAIHFTTEEAMELPERFRMATEVDLEGQKRQLIRILNGNQAWQAMGPDTTALPKEDVEDFQEEIYLLWLTTLVPLKDPAFELAPLPDGKINGQAAAGVKVTRKGHNECHLYFDKQTGFLIQAEHPSRLEGLEISRAYSFADYKDFAGLKMPAKQGESINSNKYTDLTFTDYTFPEKLNGALFTKP
jgi:hypothetical protein